jgi:hypothetical protein
MTEPPAHALPLLEAFLAFSGPPAVELAGELPACRWMPRANDARSQATNPFFERLYKGELRWWGRHNGISAPWVELPGSAAGLVWVGCWRSAILHRLEWRLIERRSVAFPYHRLGARQSWIPPIRQAPSTQLHVVERWFDVRVAPSAARKVLREGDVENWLCRQAKAGPFVGRDIMWKQMKHELGGEISRERFGELREIALNRYHVARRRAGRPLIR